MRSELIKDLSSNVLASTLILFAPVIHFVIYHQYSFVSLELIWLALMLVMLACVCGLLMSSGSRLLKFAVLSGLLTLFVDIQFDVGKAWHTGLIFIGIFAFLWVLSEHAVTITTTIFAVFILSTVALPDTDSEVATVTVDTASPDQDLPPVIHLILDEHIGIEGIPLDIDPGRDVREELLRLYVGSGFRVYGRAISQYFDTHNAIPNALNFTASDIDASYFNQERTGDYSLKENAYFERLSRKGYLIHVYQSTYLDLCGHDDSVIASCTTYASNSIKSIEDTPVSTGGKLSFIVSSIFDLSTAYRSLQVSYNRFRLRLDALGIGLPYWTQGRNRVGPLPTLPVMEMLESELSQNISGGAYIVHLNIPHYPYVLESNCQVKPDIQDWKYRKLNGPVVDGINDSEDRSELYNSYLVQMRCLNQKLAGLFATMRAGGYFDEAMIIVHGDHGSRISLLDPFWHNLDKLEEADYVDSFSTLFAVKAPGVEPGYDPRQAAIDSLLDHHTGGDRAITETDHVFIKQYYSDTLSRRPIEVPFRYEFSSPQAAIVSEGPQQNEAP